MKVGRVGHLDARARTEVEGVALPPRVVLLDVDADPHRVDAVQVERPEGAFKTGDLPREDGWSVERRCVQVGARAFGGGSEVRGRPVHPVVRHPEDKPVQRRLEVEGGRRLGGTLRERD